MRWLEEGAYRKAGVNPPPTKEDLKNRPSKPGASQLTKLLESKEILNTIKKKLDKVETKKDCVGFVRDLRKYLERE